MRWIALALVVAGCGVEDQPMTEDQLGSLLFHDPALSSPAGQACADCHARDLAFADPEDDRTSQGVIRGRFGSRNAQMAAYARFAPPLQRDVAGRMIGGLFWDGRADTLEEQALVPLLNPLEMNNPDPAAVVNAVRGSSYAEGFRHVYGRDALDDVARAYRLIGRAIAAFERTPRFAPFSSRYDRYLAGEPVLDAQELRGLAIFEDPARGGCASCHPSRPAGDGAPPLFTDFSYANLGLPRWNNAQFLALPPELNPEGEGFVDRGLGKTTGEPAHDGMFRVPSLRNVARTGPYGHNGYFRGLDEIIEFHATRDVGSVDAIGTCDRIGGVPRTACPWPAPEVPRNVDPRIGDLPLSRQDIADLVAFLETLTDAAP